MGNAYSYQRCSTVRQTGGSTKYRQKEAMEQDETLDFCRRHDLTLDTTQTFNDWGVSSFRGDNITKGALGLFLEAISMGKIKAGDCLIVEAIDRLTRLPLDDADQLLRRILRAGVSIVTIRPYQELTPADLNDLGKRMMMLAMCEVSHRSSADKSKWATGSWKKKRAEAAQKKITKLCPSWLELSEDRTQFIPIPAAEKTVRLIYKWYLDGQGVWVIARRLNREGNHGADYIGRNSFYPPCNNGTRWQNYIRLTGGNRQAVTTRRRG